MTNLLYTFIPSYKSEIIKSKRSFAFWLSVLGSFFMTLILFCIYFFEWDKVIPSAGTNPWSAYIQRIWTYVSGLLIPFYIVLTVNLLVQIEHSSNSWKNLYTLPVPRASIFFSKLLLILTYVAFTYLLFVIFIILSGYTLGLTRPDLKFLDYPLEFLELIVLSTRSFTSILGILAFQYYLSLKWKNFVIPIGIGMFAVVLGTILAGWKYAEYFPYTYPTLIIRQYSREMNVDQFLVDVNWYSILFFVIIVPLAFIEERNKSIH